MYADTCTKTIALALAGLHDEVSKKGALFVQGLTEADAQFGRFLEWLKRTGRDEYTNVITLSDHGHFTIAKPPPTPWSGTPCMYCFLTRS